MADFSQLDVSVIALFGEALTYTPFGGSATPISGVFQSPDVAPPGGVFGITTQGPMVTVLSSDVPNPKQADTILRDSNGQLYEVKEFEVDEGTLVILQLEETT